MANEGLSWTGILLRFCAALLLVFATYNPEGFSYYHWVFNDLHSLSALKVFLGVVLIIGWAIFVRATFHSLGIIGITLALAFFGSLLWVVVDWGWIPVNSVKWVSYLVLLILSWILAAGMSWSFIRRKLSGQYDVVESEDSD